MRALLIFSLVLFAFQANSQCKIFDLTSEGDTLNCVDKNDKKQGKWKLHFDAVRSNPGYDEEGLYKNDLREGSWRRYDAWGLLLALEQYKYGQKHLNQKYLEQGNLEHEESWISMDPLKKFDTVDVYEVYDQFKIEKRIVPVKPYAVQHGTWKYYDIETGKLLKKEEYVLGQLLVPKLANAISANIPAADTITKPKIIPKAVLDFDKKNKGKKNAIRDGKTG